MCSSSIIIVFSFCILALSNGLNAQQNFQSILEHGKITTKDKLLKGKLVLFIE